QKDIVLTGWTLNQNGAILSGPFLSPDGWLYLADARRGFDITSREGTHFKGKGARIWRCLPDGSQLEWFSGGGFDNAIEIVFMPSGDALGTMTYFTDPKDGQRDALMHWVEGGVYPKYHAVIKEDSLPLTGDLMPVMTKMPRIAPSGLMRYQGQSWGSDYSGNLFSAEFNTGRIMRYKVTYDGATYRTEDEAFITAREKDIHLTDVLEDADGSLLIVATGGWFIEGCPLSRMAKPEVKGGIFRVRKNTKSKTDLRESWGKDIAFDDLSLNALSDLLMDPRPRVVSNTLDALVKKGPAAIPFLQAGLSTDVPEVRASIVFALHRIGGPEAWQLIRGCLSDPHAVVQQASARSLGLAKDTLSVPSLIQVLTEGTLPVKRQTATALGRIGHHSAVPALMRTLDGDLDRFADHAVIFALIKIGDEKRMKEALKEGTPKIRSALLIALDQMEGGSLTAKEVLHSLSSVDESERKTANWIATRHPEWSEAVFSLLRNTLNGPTHIDLSTSEIGLLLVALTGDTNVQNLIAKRLTTDTSSVNRLFLLDILRQSEMNGFPDIWKSLLTTLFSDQDREIRMAVIKVIMANQLAGFDSHLNGLILDSSQPDELRLQALRAKTLTTRNPEDAEWKYLISLLHSKDPILRRQAVSLITKFELNEDQLVEIAATQLPQMEPYLVPGMLEIYVGGQSEKVGMAIIRALQEPEDMLDNLSISKMERILDSYPAAAKDYAKPLLESLRMQWGQREEKLRDLEVNLHNGDVGEGRKIFYGKGLCGTCHAIGAEGSEFGPDLSNIGEIRSRYDILEAIIYPSASFAREYETFSVISAGKTTIGIVTGQTTKAIMIKTGPDSEVRVEKNAETIMTPHPESLMPSGLERQLSDGELSDLLAFLQSLPYRIDRLVEMQEIE
ncbi:MAG: c-type cytochrome, partial [Saprospiraceae bacterium]|nr:c-type cytochrome [Saprospiraceae bacterium]